ncbi:hypothetical protein GCM10010174_41600 [Kutzneria viridogrisea]
MLTGDSCEYLRLSNRRRSDHYVIRCCVQLGGVGMRAELHDLTVFPNDHPALFFEQLAAEFTGWTGERSWQSPDRDLAVRAEYGSGGHVTLTWQARPWRHSDTGHWAAEVRTSLEAGAQTSTLAADLHRFFDPDGEPTPGDPFSCPGPGATGPW